MNSSTTLPELRTPPSQAISTPPPTPEIPAWRRVLEEIWADRDARGYRQLSAEEIDAWVAEIHDPESDET